MLAACNQILWDPEKRVGVMCMWVCVAEVREGAEGWRERLDDVSIATLPLSAASLPLPLSALAFLPSSLVTFLLSFLPPSLPPYSPSSQFVRFHEIDGAIGRCHGDAGTLILNFCYAFFLLSLASLFLFLLLITFNLPHKTLHTLKLQYFLCHLAYGVPWKAWTDVVLKIMFIPPLL